MINTNLFGMKADPDTVIQMLKTNSPSLTRLTDAKNPRGSGHVACKNQCGPNSNDSWCSLLASHLAENTHLTELHFGSGHHVQVEGAESLAKILETNTTLLKLSFVYGTPGVGPEGAFAFFSLLLCYFVTLLLCYFVVGGGKDEDKSR